MTDKKVQVLMSTYNGERFLREQIDSILRQTGVEVELLVRDDGSSDNTVDILKEYQKRNKLKWYNGSNLGPAKSFFNLIVKAGGADYYAFSDQDDVWVENKLRAAVEQLGNLSATPALYFCHKEAVDGNLKNLFFEEQKYDLSFKKAYVRNIASGCTMVFNKKMMTELKEYSPKMAWMHDAWVLRLCMALGGVVIQDMGYYIKYRQHDSNAIGAHNNEIRAKTLKGLKTILYALMTGDNKDSRMAREMLDAYKSEVSVENQETLEKLAFYYKNKAAKKELLSSNDYKVEKEIDNSIFNKLVRYNRY